MTDMDTGPPEPEIDVGLLLQRQTMALLVVNKLQEELQEILSDANTDDPRIKLRKVAIISYQIGDAIRDVVGE